MPNSTLTVHVCPFETRPCDNYTCRQALFKKKYFIGNPGGMSHKPVFCEDCIRHMFAHIPAHLVEGGEDLEAQIRDEMEQKYSVALHTTIADVEANLRDSISKEMAIKFSGAQQAGIIEAFNPEELEDGQSDVVSDPDTDEDEDEDYDHRDEDLSSPPAPKEAAKEAAKPVKTYRCLDCGEDFATPQLLGKHKKQEHA